MRRSPIQPENRQEPTIVEKGMFAGGLILGPIALSNPGHETSWDVVGYGSLAVSLAGAVSIHLRDRAAQANADVEQTLQ